MDRGGVDQEQLIGLSALQTVALLTEVWLDVVEDAGAVQLARSDAL
jgi:hypothetical protein